MRKTTISFIAVVIAVITTLSGPVYSQTLGTAQSFGVLAASTVTNTGPTIVVGNVGVSPGSSITGFGPGTVTGGTIHSNDATAIQAQNDVTTAYNFITAEPFNTNLTGQNLGGLTLTPGVYHFNTSAALTGALTLDARGDPNAVFTFQIGSTLTVASNSSVNVINGGDNDNVFWQVGSSATIGTASAFAGNVLAQISITANTGVDACGGLYARNGGVTLESNHVSHDCGSNGYSNPHLVLQSATSNQVALWYMNGTTVSSGTYTSITPDAGFKVAGEADVNGDGKPDLILQNASTHQVIIWLMKGRTVLSEWNFSPSLPNGWSIVAVGDFNNNGKPDLVLQNATTNQIAFWYLDGPTLVSGQYVSVIPASGWRVVGAADVNGDGKRDLFLQNATTDQVAVWYLNGATVTSGAYLSAVPTGYNAVGVGDFNGDGKPDLVIQNRTSNQVAFWYLNGTTVTSGAFVSVTPASGFHVVAPK